MSFGGEFLVDTNILLRVSRKDDPQHVLIGTALRTLGERGASLYFSMQNIAELWNVSTRPAERNGFGLTIGETRLAVEAIERSMTLLPDNRDVYTLWRQIVFEHNVRGVQVHDARLAAIMQVYGIGRILTLNKPDFLRYSKIQAVHPREVHLGL